MDRRSGRRFQGRPDRCAMSDRNPSCAMPEVVVELDPPRAPAFDRYLQAARRLQAAGVTHITIADNSLAHARLSNVVAAVLLRQAFGLSPIVHLNSRDRNLLAQQSTVLGLFAAGVRHFLLISGDALALGDHPDGKAVYETDSLGLMERFRGLQAGVDFFGRPLEGPLDVCYGGALNLGRTLGPHLRRLAAKADRGARFFFTQPIFDPADLERLLEARALLGGRGTLYIGIMPLISAASARFLAGVPGMNVPSDVVRALEPYTGEAAIEAGLAQAEALIERAFELGWTRFYLITPYLRASTTARLARFVLARRPATGASPADDVSTGGGTSTRPGASVGVEAAPELGP
ncbi:methylenetetrahydrofolate reductase [Hydrogenibacillus schlegelii]|uniref:Methylenetetrahydrofolate reductase n=3 Tax=Hydrogenibacillus schlegelii TaxID=1484 RepID=A0A179IT56_HYDSH|nr:methylenetetrahydrofolate reductase [Hydrogenibacillus schlegelii]MBT9281953.1 methylenetetrahydrofolate reductase [Hydrogenibacillus schlegelii]OAR04634.1 hypothetical protein SA87_08855 [Hydrogenibacillus schlegelii]